MEVGAMTVRMGWRLAPHKIQNDDRQHISGVNGWLSLLVLAHLGCPGQRAVKRLCVWTKQKIVTKSMTKWWIRWILFFLSNTWCKYVLNIDNAKGHANFVAAHVSKCFRYGHVGVKALLVSSKWTIGGQVALAHNFVDHMPFQTNSIKIPDPSISIVICWRNSHWTLYEGSEASSAISFYTVSWKKLPLFLDLTLQNAGRFSKFFHWWTQL